MNFPHYFLIINCVFKLNFETTIQMNNNDGANRGTVHIYAFEIKKIEEIKFRFD